MAKKDNTRHFGLKVAYQISLNFLNKVEEFLKRYFGDLEE
jgi:hypothetical protein